MAIVRHYFSCDLFLKLNPLFPFPVFILIQTKPSEQLLVPFPGPPVPLIFPCILCVCVCDIGVSSWLFFCVALCVVVHPVPMGRFVSLCLARPRTSQPEFTSLGPRGQRCLCGFSVCAYAMNILLSLQSFLFLKLGYLSLRLWLAEWEPEGSPLLE